MTQISKRKLSENIEKRITEIFCESIVSLKNTNQVSSFLDEFLSPTEKLVLSKRLAIAVLLTKGYNYSAIKETLKVTSSTISKVAYFIKYRGKEWKKIANLIINDEEKSEFWKDLDFALAKILTYHKGLYGIGERERLETERQREQSKII
jgi:uncharacterized protein YerC